MQPAAELQSILDEATRGGIPGVQLAASDLDGSSAIEVHAGAVSTEPKAPPVTASTRFDLASLTKLYTATVALRLATSGRLDLDLDVGVRLGRAHLVGITPRMLLEHRAGLPAWRPLYADPRGVREAALATAPDTAGHVYSDLGFLVLGVLLEDIGGASLDVLIGNHVLAPFGLAATSFRDRGGAPLDGTIAATRNTEERGAILGVVDDDNAFALGGVAPHAGLFAPATDVLRFARSFWAATHDGTIAPTLGTALWGEIEPGTHVLGFDTRAAEASTVAPLSPRCRGHLGFTGTALWIDPERHLAFALLSNRVHPEPRPGPIRALRLAVAEALARQFPPRA